MIHNSSCNFKIAFIHWYLFTSGGFVKFLLGGLSPPLFPLSTSPPYPPLPTLPPVSLPKTQLGVCRSAVSSHILLAKMHAMFSY